MSYCVVEGCINLLALADMRGNLVVAAIVLVIGAVLLRALNPKVGLPTQRRWVPMAAIVCGPVTAFLYFVAHVLWISPQVYLTARDYVESLVLVFLIGIIGGTIGAIVLWLGELVFAFTIRQGRRSTEAHPGEQSHPPEPPAGPVSNGVSSPPAQ